MTTLGDRKILPLALGANPFGWTADEATSHAVLDAFVDGGGTVVDTSDSYGAGASETILGSWFARSGRRDDVLLASKVGRHPERPGLAAANVRAAVDDSLRRLQTDRLDLLWAHYDDPGTPLAETLETFDALVTEGKVGELGISNYSPDRIREWLGLVEEHGWRRPVALQPEYSLLRRHDYEDDRQALALQHDLAVLPYWGLASGLLTGKYRTAADVTGQARAGIVQRYVSPEAFDVVGVLREVADAHDAQPSTVALAWLLGRPGVSAPGLALTDDESARLTAASDAVGR